MTNYELAKAAIKNAKRNGANVLVYYNTYKSFRTLKVLFFGFSDEERAVNFSLRVVLDTWATEVRETAQGDRIYQFPL